MASKDDIYAKMTVAAAVFFAIFEIGYLFTTTPPFDMPGYVIGRDFVATWIGAKSHSRSIRPHGLPSTPSMRGWRRCSIKAFPCTTGPIRRTCC